ncbi:MAG: PIN domain-containing protein [Bacteroidetes bacterium]|nr:PIN domain-containing protein [Bacteroidota bacterium]
MKRVFVDTNIIIDLIADRKPFSKFAIEIFDAAEKKRIDLFASSHSLATVHYLLKKNINEAELRQILLSLITFITIVPIDEHVIQRSLKSKHKDFEDAIQIIAAQSVDKINCIITRNVKDFKGAEIAVLTPDEFVKFNL